MATLTYKPENLISTVLNVLDYCSWCYTNIAFRLAIKYHCPDLKGMINIHTVEETDLIFLKSLDDPILLLMTESIGQFELTKKLIANLYTVKSEDIGRNESISVIAADFYYRTTIDGIPIYSEEEDRISYDDTLDLYALSLINVINWLFVLIITGEADLEQSFDENHPYTHFLEIDYTQEEFAVVLDLLRKLGVHLYHQHAAIIEMH